METNKKEKGNKKKVMTVYRRSVIKKEKADDLYEFLESNVQWEEGIKSSKSGKETRKAYSVSMKPNDKMVDDVIKQIIFDSLNQDYLILGVYVNYYRDGNDWAPTHSHPGTIQSVISLGATRTLKIGKKDHVLNSGDVITFGASSHSLLQEPSVKEGRISIATFMILPD